SRLVDLELVSSHVDHLEAVPIAVPNARASAEVGLRQARYPVDSGVDKGRAGIELVVARLDEVRRSRDVEPLVSLRCAIAGHTGAAGGIGVVRDHHRRMASALVAKDSSSTILALEDVVEHLGGGRASYEVKGRSHWAAGIARYRVHDYHLAAWPGRHVDPGALGGGVGLDDVLHDLLA